MIKEKGILKKVSMALAASLMSMMLVIPTLADSLVPIDAVKIDSVANHIEVTAASTINVFYVTDKTVQGTSDKLATKVTWQRLNIVGGYNATGTAQRNTANTLIDRYEHYTAGYEGTGSNLEYSWLFNGNDADWSAVTSTTQRPYYLVIDSSVTSNTTADIIFEMKTTLPGEAHIMLKVPGMADGTYTLHYEEGCTGDPIHGIDSTSFVPQIDQSVTVQNGYVSFDIMHGGYFTLAQ